MWPTPQANKTTPNTVDVNDLVNSKGELLQPGQKPHDRRTGRPVTTVLADAVKMWPTPQAGANNPAAHNAMSGHFKTKFCERAGIPVTGQLNPTWVEWLMGFPLGWTDLED
jgi:DNA (cytosine-5)-methyltransferase 1